MSSEPERQDWAARRRESKRARKKNAVLKYLVILFAVAFLLLLYSYFAQQRATARPLIICSRLQTPRPKRSRTLLMNGTV